MTKRLDGELSNLLLFISGRFESLLGWAALMVAMPLFVLDKTGSGTMMGIFSLAGALPRFVILPFAGVIGDRMNRKHLMVFLDLAKGSLLLLSFLLSLYGKLTITGLLIFYVFFGIISALFDAPSSAMLADLVNAERLRKAVSLNTAATSLAQIAGPAVGGLLYGFSGMTYVLLFTGVFYIFSAVSELFIRYNFSKRIITESVFKEIANGIKFVVSNRGLKSLFIFAAIANFISAPAFSVVIPYILRKELNFSAQWFGILEMLFMVGALFGSLLTATLFSSTDSKRLVTIGITLESFIGCLMALLLMQVGTQKSLSMFLSSFFLLLIGIFNMLVNVPIGANLQALIPSQVRSRVLSILTIFSSGLTPIGSLLGGIIVDRMNAFGFFLLLNLLILAVSLAFVFLAPREAFLQSQTK
ncbi:MFS transporter [Pseudothermotoga sp. U03pept]|uniref:MFS transporter n=1 Tax=Pseudothermotoga sp. U03pept TaxID=3447012 RepID=UPI003F09B951